MFARIVAVLFLSSLAVFAGSDPASACRVTSMQGIPGATVNGTMSVEHGKSCMTRQFTNMSDAIGTRRFPTTDMWIVNGPSRGRVDISGNRIVYKAAGAGADTFTYAARVKTREFKYQVLVSVY